MKFNVANFFKHWRVRIVVAFVCSVLVVTLLPSGATTTPIGISGPIVKGSWVEIPLSNIPYQELVGIDLTTTSKNPIAFASREDASGHQPQIVKSSSQGVVTVKAVADTSVAKVHPNTNYGTSPWLFVEATRDIRSYLKFKLPVSLPDGSTIGTRPDYNRTYVLRLWALTSNSVGVKVRMTGTNWIESGAGSLTYNTRPPLVQDSTTSTSTTTTPSTTTSTTKVPPTTVKPSKTYDLASYYPNTSMYKSSYLEGTSNLEENRGARSVLWFEWQDQGTYRMYNSAPEPSHYQGGVNTSRCHYDVLSWWNVNGDVTLRYSKTHDECGDKVTETIYDPPIIFLPGTYISSTPWKLDYKASVKHYVNGKLSCTGVNDYTARIEGLVRQPIANTNEVEENLHWSTVQKTTWTRGNYEIDSQCSAGGVTDWREDYVLSDNISSGNLRTKGLRQAYGGNADGIHDQWNITFNSWEALPNL